MNVIVSAYQTKSLKSTVRNRACKGLFMNYRRQIGEGEFYLGVTTGH
jgi:hypothetical protein